MIDPLESEERHAPSTCPTCRKVLDRSSSLQEGRARRPGDFSVCMYCGALLRFREDLQLTPATAQDRKELSEENRVVIAEAQRLIRLQPKRT